MFENDDMSSSQSSPPPSSEPWWKQRKVILTVMAVVVVVVMIIAIAAGVGGGGGDGDGSDNSIPSPTMVQTDIPSGSPTMAPSAVKSMAPSASSEPSTSRPTFMWTTPVDIVQVITQGDSTSDSITGQIHVPIRGGYFFRMRDARIRKKKKVQEGSNLRRKLKPEEDQTFSGTIQGFETDLTLFGK